MAPVTLMRRNIVLAAFLALALVGLLYTRSPFDTVRVTYTSEQIRQASNH